MAIPKDIKKIDDLLETAMDMLPLGEKTPRKLLGNLKQKMKMFTGEEFDTQTVKNAYDRYNFKNRFSYGKDYVMSMSNTMDTAPKVGQNFIDDKGRYYIFEKTAKDEVGQNVFQFRSPTGTKEQFIGSKYSHKLNKTDNVYDLKSAKEYGDDMYELYVHKQKFNTLNANDRVKYYEEHISPVVQRITEKQQKINFDHKYYYDKDGQDLMNWADDILYNENVRTNRANNQTNNRANEQQQQQTTSRAEEETNQTYEQEEVDYDYDDYESPWGDEDLDDIYGDIPIDEEEDQTPENSSNNQDTQQQQNTGSFDPDDPSTWTDDDIRRMSDGDPYVAQELINQRNAARGQSGGQSEGQNTKPFDENDPSTWTDDDIRRMSEGDPYVAQDLIKQRNAARGQSGGQDQVKIDERVIKHEEVINQGGPGTPDDVEDMHSQSVDETVDKHNRNAPDPDQAASNVEQTVKKNDWRKKIKDQQRSQRGVNVINVNETNAKVNVDTSDPYNIFKTIEDADGNIRTQHWRRKGEWSGDTELISDISQNQYGTYDNITGTYTGQDRSPIDWINADEWDDDYILGRAGDDEDLLNSMMNARERKMKENERYRQSHPEFDADTSTNDVPSTDDPIPDNAHNVNPGPQVNPDDPLTWTEEYMDEMSEGDPTYYEHLKQQKLNAEKAERFKKIDPNNPTTWTDEYIKDTAKNQDEINEMTKRMRDAKNLDTVDEINKQRQNQRPPNRQERRQEKKDNRQKGNTQKKKTKKQKEKDKRNQKFKDRHKAMGNDPDDVKRTNQQYNEEQKQKKK